MRIMPESQALSKEKVLRKDIFETGRDDSTRKERQVVAEERVKAILQVNELPDQKIESLEHKEFGEKIAQGDKVARNQYAMRRLRSIMLAAQYRFSLQEPVVNLTLEDHFQDILENFLERLDEYPEKQADIPDFSEYTNRNLYWLSLDHRIEEKNLPFSKLGNRYDERDPVYMPLFSEGPQPYHEIDPQLEGSDTTQLLEHAVLSIAQEGLSKGMQDKLSQRNEDVLKMRTGILSGLSRHTLAEVADEFDLTPQRVRQIEELSIKALASTVEIQKLKKIFEDISEGEFLNQNTPPSLYKVNKAVEALALIDKRTLEGRSLERFVDTWKDHYFPNQKRRVTQTEVARARFKIKQANKYKQKS